MRNFCVSFLPFKKRVYKGEKENTHSRVLSFFGKTGGFLSIEMWIIGEMLYLNV